MTRNTALSGLAVVVAFVALASISGAWSPLGRRPVLDGLGPLAPYRWVSPPPELVAENTPPLPGSFELAVDDDGSEPDVLVSPDDQVTLILDRGAIEAAPGRRTAIIELVPLDPADLAPLPEDLAPFGNAIRVDAKDVTAFVEQVDVLLLYPETVTLHARRHEILWSADGQTWRRLETADSLATQQAQATIEAPGFVVVGAVPVPHPSASVSAAEASSDTAPVVVVVVGVAVLLGIAIAIRIRAHR